MSDYKKGYDQGIRTARELIEQAKEILPYIIVDHHNSNHQSAKQILSFLDELLMASENKDKK